MFNSLISTLQGPAEEAVDDSATVTLPAQAAAVSASQPPQDGSGPSSPSQPEEAPLMDPAGRDAGTDDGDETAGSSSSATAAEAAAAAPGQAGTGNAFSFWGMASGLVDTVRKGTNDLASRCEPPGEFSGRGATALH